FGPLGFKSDSGIFLDIEKVRAAQVLVPHLDARIDRGRVNCSFEQSLAWIGGIIIRAASDFPELAPDRGNAQMTNSKLRRRVVGIDLPGLDLGKRRRDEGKGSKANDQFANH